jgi:hypothetical protein
MFEYSLNFDYLSSHCIVSEKRFCAFLIKEDQYYNYIISTLIFDNLRVKNV